MRGIMRVWSQDAKLHGLVHVLNHSEHLLGPTTQQQNTIGLGYAPPEFETSPSGAMVLWGLE